MLGEAICVTFVQLALAEAQYDLAAELLRFVVPPTDNDNLFASINGAHTAGQQAGAAKDASPAPPRVKPSMPEPTMLWRALDITCLQARRHNHILITG